MKWSNLVINIYKTRLHESIFIV